MISIHRAAKLLNNDLAVHSLLEWIEEYTDPKRMGEAARHYEENLDELLHVLVEEDKTTKATVATLLAIGCKFQGEFLGMMELHRCDLAHRASEDAGCPN